MLNILLAAAVATMPQSDAVSVSGGTIRQADSLPVVIHLDPAPKTRVLAINSTAYLNIGNGNFVHMSVGRCTYTTSYQGKSYADQDFDLGVGVGKPLPNARACGESWSSISTSASTVSSGGQSANAGGSSNNVSTNRHRASAASAPPVNGSTRCSPGSLVGIPFAGNGVAPVTNCE